MTNPDNVGGLLPCPFCGGEPKLVKCVGYDQGQSSISCPSCDVCLMDIHNHVVETWNRRELCRAAPAGGCDCGSAATSDPDQTRHSADCATYSATAGGDVHSETCLSRNELATGGGHWHCDCGVDAREFGIAAPAGGDAFAAFDQITGLSKALRQGGPEPEDLQELSDALDEAVGIAGNMLAKVSAPAGSGEVEELIHTLRREAAKCRTRNSYGGTCEANGFDMSANMLAALLRKLQQGADRG